MYIPTMTFSKWDISRISSKRFIHLKKKPSKWLNYYIRDSNRDNTIPFSRLFCLIWKRGIDWAAKIILVVTFWAAGSSSFRFQAPPWQESRYCCYFGSFCPPGPGFGQSAAEISHGYWAFRRATGPLDPSSSGYKAWCEDSRIQIPVDRRSFRRPDSHAKSRGSNRDSHSIR